MLSSAVSRSLVARHAFRLALPSFAHGHSWAGAPVSVGGGRRWQRARATMAAQDELTAYVKGDPATDTLGDCPFCHKVLITMVEKSVPHKREYIAFGNKPAWFLEANPAGTVPVIKVGEELIPDSDVIMEYLEEKFPNPPMAVTEEEKGIGASMFSSFRAFAIPPEGGDVKDLEAKFVAELKALDDQLTAKGPFLGGDQLNAIDAKLLPLLYHSITVLKHYKDWEVPADMKALHAYLTAAKERPSWKANDYGEEMIIKGWAPKFAAAAA